MRCSASAGQKPDNRSPSCKLWKWVLTWAVIERIRTNAFDPFHRSAIRLSCRLPSDWRHCTHGNTLP